MNPYDFAATDADIRRQVVTDLRDILPVVISDAQLILNVVANSADPGRQITDIIRRFETAAAQYINYARLLRET